MLRGGHDSARARAARRGSPGAARPPLHRHRRPVGSADHPTSGAGAALCLPHSDSSHPAFFAPPTPPPPPRPLLASDRPPHTPTPHPHLRCSCARCAFAAPLASAPRTPRPSEAAPATRSTDPTTTPLSPRARQRSRRRPRARAVLRSGSACGCTTRSATARRTHDRLPVEPTTKTRHGASQWRKALTN